jgi:hypothetical protein
MSELVSQVQQPAEKLLPLLGVLVDKKYLIQVDAVDALYSPARDPETILLAEVLHGFRQGSSGSVAMTPGTDPVIEVLVSVDKAIDDVLQGISLKQWVLSDLHPVTPALKD